MKITDVEVLRMQAFTEPQNNWLFVRVHTDEGISGLGKGSLQCKDAALAAEIENFAFYLRGKDPFRIEDIWTSLHQRVTWCGGAVTIYLPRRRPFRNDENCRYGRDLLHDGISAQL